MSTAEPGGTKLRRTADQRRRIFAEHVAAGKSGVEAAMLAGFKGNKNTLAMTASRLIRNDNVKQLIETATEKASKGRILTAQRRREILADIAEGKVQTKSDGPTGTTVRDPTPAERVRAIEHLDNLDGLVRQKHELSGPNGQPLAAVLATVSEDTIRARLAELAKRGNISAELEKK